MAFELSDKTWKLGFTPTPYQSGERAREPGMTKSGNPHVRWMTTELAWSGLCYQPESALSVGFRKRFRSGGKRLRWIGMVAVARSWSDVSSWYWAAILGKTFGPWWASTLAEVSG